MSYSTKDVLSAVMLWAAFTAVIYAWWLAQGSEVITKKSYEQARATHGPDPLIKLLTSDDSSASLLVTHPYQQMFSYHSPRGVLSQGLSKRCSVYFSRYRHVPLVHDTLDFDSFREFRSVPEVKNRYRQPVENIDDYEYLKFAESVYPAAVEHRDHQERALSESLSNIRVYLQCSAPSETTNAYIKNQLKRLANFREKLVLDGNDVDFKAGELEGKIFPWLTGVIPDQAVATNTPTGFRLGRSETVLHKLSKTWSGKGVVVVGNDDATSIVESLLRHTKLPIEVIVNQYSPTKEFGDKVRVIEITDATQNLELSLPVAMLFSSFSEVIGVATNELENLESAGFVGKQQLYPNSRLWRQLKPSQYDEVVFGVSAKEDPVEMVEADIVRVDKKKNLSILLLSIELQRHPGVANLVKDNELWWGNVICGN